MKRALTSSRPAVSYLVNFESISLGQRGGVVGLNTPVAEKWTARINAARVRSLECDWDPVWPVNAQELCTHL